MSNNEKRPLALSSNVQTSGLSPTNDFRAYELLYKAALLEIESLTDDELLRVATLMDAVTESKLYMFFTQENLERLAEAMKNHLAIRGFVLGLHERYVMMTALTGLQNAKDGLFVEIHGILQSRVAMCSDASLLIPPVRVTLSPGTLDEMAEFVEANQWLMTLYFALFSGAYSSAMHDNIHS